MPPLTPKVLLYRGHNFHDTLIRWQTWGSVAHSALWFPDPQLGGQIVEAVLSGVIVRTQANPFSEPAEVYDVAGAVNWNHAQNYANNQVGKPYDIKGLFQFVARSGSDDPDSWFCSDLVFESVWQGGVLLVARVPRCKVSPEQLRRSPLLVRATNL